MKDKVGLCTGLLLTKDIQTVTFSLVKESNIIMSCKWTHTECLYSFTLYNLEIFKSFSNDKV